MTTPQWRTRCHTASVPTTTRSKVASSGVRRRYLAHALSELRRDVASQRRHARDALVSDSSPRRFDRSWHAARDARRQAKLAVDLPLRPVRRPRIGRARRTWRTPADDRRRGAAGPRPRPPDRRPRARGARRRATRRAEHTVVRVAQATVDDGDSRPSAGRRRPTNGTRRRSTTTATAWLEVHHSGAVVATTSFAQHRHGVPRRRRRHCDRPRRRRR